MILSSAIDQTVFVYSIFVALCAVMLNLNEQYLIFTVLKQEPKTRKGLTVTHISPRQPAVQSVIPGAYWSLSFRIP